MATPEALAAALLLKEQANAEFASENYLKAAGLYSKAIIQDPDNAVLYSNRSAALLKLKKVTKALEDAEACIKLRPDWEKGYFRKGAVLEDQEKLEEALDLYQQALKTNPDSKELSSKIRTLSKLIGIKTKGSSRKEPEATAKPAPPQEEQPEEEDLGSVEVATFTQEMLLDVALEIKENGTSFTPMIHFLPGPGSEPHEAPDRHIKGQGAFESPENLRGFIDFIRQQGSKLDALAVLSVMPKSSIAVPQTWTKPSWRWGSGDFVLVQLDSKQTRKCWFIPVDADRQIGASASIDPEAFGPMPALLR